jgi:GAF domain
LPEDRHYLHPSDDADRPDTGMDVVNLLGDQEFLERDRPSDRTDRQFEALHCLAHVFAEKPDDILQKLVDIAVEFCNADSSGISLEEPDGKGGWRFRWIVVSGSFSQYLNGTTPRFYSPCGTCLNRNQPQHYRLAEPYYSYLGVVAEPIRDGILIPWISENTRGTLWAVSHRSPEAFVPGDYKLLNSLADFAAIAIRYNRQATELRARDQEYASAARAHELAHQINNPLQSLANLLFLAGDDGPGTQVFVKQASQEVSTLSALVRDILSLRLPSGKPPKSDAMHG